MTNTFIEAHNTPFEEYIIPNTVIVNVFVPNLNIADVPFPFG